MGFQTAAFAAQDALVAALNDVSDLSAWQIDYGLPSVRQEQHIWVDESIEDGTQETATTGIVTKDEAFRLNVYVYSRKTGATAKELRDEIAAASGVVSDTIGGAPFLGGAVLFAEVVNYAYEGAFADPQGKQREAVFKLTVACKAFLTA